ncbi:hypothetical protein ACHAXT_001179 [Thalassiosira profunda]
MTSEKLTSRGSLSTPEGFKANVLAALQLARKDLAARHEKANFIRIIMRFPKIRAVFDRLRAIHHRCDKSGDGQVDVGELTEAMTELFNEGRAQGRDPIRPEVVARTMSISEVEEEGAPKNQELDVKQFIVMCAVGFILAEEDNNLSTFGGMLASGDDAYRSAMKDVVTAYLSFDREGKGYFTADEFNGAFFTDERWAELDVSGDGKVEFEEFVYAFSKWVSDDEDDDDEETEDGKSILDKQEKAVNFTRIIMRFPQIHAVFDRIRTTHAKIENIFMLSDLDHHGMEEGLDVKEFIVFCAVGFILAEAGGKSAKLATGAVSDNDKEYRKAMMDIVGAYLTFDKDAKGYFTSDEMHTAVAANKKKDAGSLLTPERWRELDIDHSGKVDFEEFVFAFSTWVTAMDDEDEE